MLLDQLPHYGPFKKKFAQLKGVSGGGHGKGLQRRAGRAISDLSEKWWMRHATAMT